jgi:hypothetical protein
MSTSINNQMMKKQTINRLITGCLLIPVLFIGGDLRAQDASFSEVMHDLNLIQQNFRVPEGSYVSCSISYLYSRESRPDTYLDSLPGLYKSSGSSRYTKIGNTEAIQNDSLLLAVYNDDKAIVASPVSYATRNDHGLFLNKVDSAFVATNVRAASITESHGLKTMFFYFTDSSLYYNCNLVYDADTYIPQTISYIFRSTKLAESGKPPSDGGVITIRFSEYSRAAFDTSLLSINKYINPNTGPKAALQPAYSGYSIFQNGK